MSTWAAFINTPADLGYDATGYDMPPINIVEHCISYDIKEQPKNNAQLSLSSFELGVNLNPFLIV